MFLLSVFVVGLLLPHASTARYACDRQKNACGCPRDPPITPKIVGGVVARSHVWSWIVSLRVRDMHFCGGTILNERFIITAAHCLAERVIMMSNVTICAGIDRLADECSQTLFVANVTLHHGFSLRTVENDIALIQLATPIDFSDPLVSRICLPNTAHPEEYPAVGTYVVAAGWGSTRLDGRATNEMRQVSLKVLNKTAPICASNTFNSRIQLCAYSPGKDTCRGDSGGPLMAFSRSKQWEIVGIISFGRSCGNHEYAGGYTRLTAYQDFIEQVINGTHVKPVSRQCTCQCPYGNSQGTASTNEHRPEACVAACINIPFNGCTSRNTYACLDQECAYSTHYTNSTGPPHDGRYQCACQCPYGTAQGVAYAVKNSTLACISACIAVQSNGCQTTNTYACLGTRCAYSSDYINSTSSLMTGRYRCTCQCPYGNDQGVVYATENSTQACIHACMGDWSNRCVSSNTYACLDTQCAYSSSYINSTSAVATGGYRCTCQCPYGNDQGVAYTTSNSSYTCISACIGVSSNRCVTSNTYACLGTECVYSSGYASSSAVGATGGYRCTCQCPYGSDSGVAYASQNSSAACVDACRMASGNPCHSFNTYACLGTDCAASSSYVQRCSCQCPFGSTREFIQTPINNTEQCVNACIAVDSNNCAPRNTYACVHDRCAYSAEYDNSSIGKPARFRCTCHCPADTYQGIAYTKSNSTEACVNACTTAASNTCRMDNTYACLGAECAYSASYEHSSTTPAAPRYRCSCQCPQGHDEGLAFTTENSSQACVDACQAIPSNPCVDTNTYACLGSDCLYSHAYNHSSAATPGGYRCVCQCPYGSNEGVAYASENSADACVNACSAVPWNSCDSSNTYACRDEECAYSQDYIY